MTTGGFPVYAWATITVTDAKTPVSSRLVLLPIQIFRLSYIILLTLWESATLIRFRLSFHESITFISPKSRKKNNCKGVIASHINEIT